MLTATNSIVEATQLWWSVRPHHAFGTVELRICDAQTRGEESFALAGLITACIAQTAIDFDEGALGEPPGDREIEENLWRAIRSGLGGTQIDFSRGTAAAEVIPTRAAVERLVEWTEPARAELGIAVEIPERNGAERARERLEGGLSIPEVYREIAAETERTYAPPDGASAEPPRPQAHSSTFHL